MGTPARPEGTERESVAFIYDEDGEPYGYFYAPATEKTEETERQEEEEENAE